MIKKLPLTLNKYLKKIIHEFKIHCIIFLSIENMNNKSWNFEI